MQTGSLPAAVHAFDAVAENFDARYGAWRSVAAQRRAVRCVLLRTFPRGARILEIGGGTGEDALWLARQGREVLVTDASPSMVAVAQKKLRGQNGSGVALARAECLEGLAEQRERAGAALFDGAFSNFAGLNCIADLEPVARGLARLVGPRGQVVLVLFGTFSPGEFLVEVARGRLGSALRRRSRREVPARLGGRAFMVRYHRQGEIARAFRPWFRPVHRRGIGIFVPPSAAEPWISEHPRLLRMLEAVDRVATRAVPFFGDHVLYQFERRSERV